jgi:hypothetical protein
MAELADAIVKHFGDYAFKRDGFQFDPPDIKRFMVYKEARHLCNITIFRTRVFTSSRDNWLIPRAIKSGSEVSIDFHRPDSFETLAEYLKWFEAVAKSCTGSVNCRGCVKKNG